MICVTVMFLMSQLSGSCHNFWIMIFALLAPRFITLRVLMISDYKNSINYIDNLTSTHQFCMHTIVNVYYVLFILFNFMVLGKSRQESLNTLLDHCY